MVVQMKMGRREVDPLGRGVAMPTMNCWCWRCERRQSRSCDAACPYFCGGTKWRQTLFGYGSKDGVRERMLRHMNRGYSAY